MNSLSWLLYLSEVVPQFGVFLVLGAIASAIAGGLSFVVYAASEGEVRSIPVAWRLMVAAVILAGVAVMIPSRQTILMIASSEIGETVVKTPEAQEIFGDLKAILKKQLEELKK